METAANRAQRGVSDSLSACSLPSPPTPVRVRDPLDSPPPQSHGGLLKRSPGAALRRVFHADDTTTVLPSLPDHVEALHVTTPLTETPVQPNMMNLIVGGALAPLPCTPPPPKDPLRPGPGLRLPSFEELGIAAPHPDRFGALSFGSDNMPHSLDGSNEAPAGMATSDSFVDAFDSLGFSSALTERPQIQPKLPPGLVRTPFLHDVATLTPPAESGEPTWQPISSTSNAPMDSPSTDPGNVSTHPLETGTASETAPPAAASSLPQLTNGGAQAWVNDALEILRK